MSVETVVAQTLPEGAHDQSAPSLPGKLPLLLRTGGALAVLGSLYFFFMQGWQGSDDLVRYSMLLGHTLLLALLAVASGHWLREGKGARLLLVLALISVTANFSILGSFLYAQVGPPLSAQFNGSLLWNLHSLWLSVALALIVPVLLLPVVVLGFRVLARDCSARLIGLFVLSNGVLLIPVRDPVLVSVMAVGLTAYTLMFAFTTQRQRIEARTLEGHMALALQFLPLATLLVRNLWLHGGSEILAAVAAGCSFLALRQLAAVLSSWRWALLALELVSALLSLVVAVCLGAAVDHVGPESMALVVAVFVAAAMLYELSLRASCFAAGWRVIAALLMAWCLGLGVFLQDDWVIHLALLFAGATVVWIGWLQRQRVLLWLGMLMVLVTLGHGLAQLWGRFDINLWLLATLCGMAAIVIASLLESRSGQVRQWLLVSGQT